MEELAEKGRMRKELRAGIQGTWGRNQGGLEKRGGRGLKELGAAGSRRRSAETAWARGRANEVMESIELPCTCACARARVCVMHVRARTVWADLLSLEPTEAHEG